jgi:hypothetical protein
MFVFNSHAWGIGFDVIEYRLCINNINLYPVVYAIVESAELVRIILSVYTYIRTLFSIYYRNIYINIFFVIWKLYIKLSMCTCEQWRGDMGNQETASS